MKFLKISLFLLFIFLGILSYVIFDYFHESIIFEDKYFVVNKGNTFKDVVNSLVVEKVIKSKDKYIFFYISKIIKKNNVNVKTGEYLFLKNSSPFELLNKLQKGDIFYRKITIAEGLSNDSIFKLVDTAFGLTGDMPDIKEIQEGTLLPETYSYTFGDKKKDIIFRMQDAMVNFFTEEWEKRAKDLPFKTKKEALSLASIVEKETGISEERKKVASVFVNRLRKEMKLQSDPTVVYAFTKGNKDLERKIFKSDLEIDSEYNTYKIKGIPENPIANPGKDAIRATLKPDTTEYLYFVAKPNGAGHNFSKNLEEHNNFVKEYRKSQNNYLIK